MAAATVAYRKRPNAALFFDAPEEFYNLLPVAKRVRANDFVSKPSSAAVDFVSLPGKPSPDQQEPSRVKEMIGELLKEITTLKEQGEAIFQENKYLKQENIMLKEQGEAIFQENCLLRKANEQSEAIAGEMTGLKKVIVSQFKQQEEMKQEIHQLKSILELKDYEIGFLRQTQLGNHMNAMYNRDVF